jgi:transposase
MNKNSVTGLDLAKNVFHLADMTLGKSESKQKKLRRKQLAIHFANLPPTCIAMEACASSHYWARLFISQGHEVKLLPPQHVKGYLRGQKNDFNDAKAIAEASLHGRVRSVPVKTVNQQDEQMFHRIREQLIRDRTALVNQLRGVLGERGIILSLGIAAVRRQIPEILSSETNELEAFGKRLISRQYQRLLNLDCELEWYDLQLKEQVKNNDDCRRLTSLPGFGPVVSSAFKSWIGDGKQFNRGRDASAALGTVPRQYTTGGKTRLGRITKRGDKYVRSLVIHGARAVIQRSAGKDDPLSQWINKLKAKRGINKATVALANKLIRIAWVIIAKGEVYKLRNT